MDNKKPSIGSIKEIYDRYNYAIDQEKGLRNLGFSRVIYLHPKKEFNVDKSDESIWQNDHFIVWLDYINCRIMIFEKSSFTKQGFKDFSDHVEDDGMERDIGLEKIGENREFTLFADVLQKVLVLREKGSGNEIFEKKECLDTF